MPEHNADLYGVVARCAAVTTTKADCEAIDVDATTPKCMFFKHFGACKGNNFGDVHIAPGLETKQACIDGCQAEATCENVEFVESLKLCRYFTGKCS